MANFIKALHVQTQPLETPPDLIPLTEAQSPLVWVRDGHGFVGRGVALRLSFSGAGRFREAATALQEVARVSEVSDSLKRPGTGLTAFGAFALDDESARESVLIVPRVIIGKDLDGGWITTLSELTERVASAPHEALPTAEALGENVVASFVEPDGEAAAYREGVLQAASRIASGEAQKIVLARRLIARIQKDADLRVPLAKLAERYTDCYTFAVDGMIGASPETLIRSVGSQVSARVLAGTRKRSLDPERDLRMRDELFTSDKERFEHLLAIQSLIETLTPFVSELEFDENPYLLQLPNVWHLASNVSARLTAGASAIELAGAQHPTAAVAGTPTRAAIAAIAELEPFDRERYAGAVGWANAAGDGDWAIALRSAQVDDAGDHKSVTAFAGGGLVAGSDPWHELTETVAKFRPIIEAFS